MGFQEKLSKENLSRSWEESLIQDGKAELSLPSPSLANTSRQQVDIYIFTHFHSFPSELHSWQMACAKHWQEFIN